MNADVANEVNDVRRDVVWIAPGKANVVHIGRAIAKVVAGEVTVDGELRRFEVDTIAHGDGPVLESRWRRPPFDRKQRSEVRLR
ncbi:hypothetical protein [uncultured Amnibacterium sp.]|uniref:hypothetical protein n=1 Tax=uncultured Amnibacterium sp. TaxID=1631851 RepID=UPI0035CB341D